MTRKDTLHERLITAACENHGWHRTGREGTNWKKVFAEACKTNEYWWGEFGPADLDDIELEPGEALESVNLESEVASIIRGIRVVPDAWRLQREGPETPDRDWSYEVLVLEFLEVEVSNGINVDKRQLYESIWWLFDGTSCFHFRVFHMDRFGVIRPYMTEDTIYTVMDNRGPFAP